MATRAERFRAGQERRGPKKQRKGPVGAHGAQDPHGRKRNPNRAAARKATYALETHTPRARPSRKSTRASANRSKPDTNFQLRSERAARAPKARRARRGA